VIGEILLTRRARRFVDRLQARVNPGHGQPIMEVPGLFPDLELQEIPHLLRLPEEALPFGLAVVLVTQNIDGDESRRHGKHRGEDQYPGEFDSDSQFHIRIVSVLPEKAIEPGDPWPGNQAVALKDLQPITCASGCQAGSAAIFTPSARTYSCSFSIEKHSGAAKPTFA